MKILSAALAASIMIGCQPAAAEIPVNAVEANYYLDTEGEPLEVYEFNPETLPEKTCVILIVGDNYGVIMECFDTEEDE